METRGVGAARAYPEGVVITCMVGAFLWSRRLRRRGGNNMESFPD